MTPRTISLLIPPLFAACLCTAAWSGEAAKETPPKITPVSDEEKAKALEAETAEQKALREALKSAGLIAFSSNLDGVRRIYLANADGSDVKCLTPAPGPGGDYPHISPDKTKIAYTAPATPEIIKSLPCAKGVDKNYVKGSCSYVMDIDGKNPTPVAAGGMPHWSWNGKKLIYGFDTMGRGGYGKVAILDLEKKTETVISPPNCMQTGMPCFTPDGKYVIISNGAGLLVQLNEAGNGPAEDNKRIQLVGGHPCNLEISADGKWIAWVVDTHGCLGSSLQYAEFKADGKAVRGKNFPLGWKEGSCNYFPEFSPDVKYFVYSHAEQKEGVKSWLHQSEQELYAATFPDCKTTVRLTWNGAGNQHPHWR
jgi:Tol biopolymer transport system component